MAQLDYPDTSQKSPTWFRKAFGQNLKARFCQADWWSDKGFGLCRRLKLLWQSEIIPPRTKKPRNPAWSRRLSGGLSERWHTKYKHSWSMLL